MDGMINLCSHIYYYLSPQTIGVEHPDPEAFKQIGKFIEHRLNGCILDAIIYVRTDLNHKHKNEDVVESELFDRKAKEAYEDFLTLSKRDFTTLLSDTGVNSKNLSGGTRYVLKMLTEGNQKNMGVEPQTYLDILRVCNWLETLDEKLATQEAVEEAYRYTKETAEDWVSPWKKVRLYRKKHSIDYLNYHLIPETIGLENPDPNIFKQIGKFIEHRLTLSVRELNNPLLSDYDLRIHVLTDLNHKHKEPVASGTNNDFAEFLDREARKAYEEFLKLRKHDFTTLLIDASASGKNLSDGTRYILEKLTESNKNKVDVNPQKYLDILSVCKWLKTLDEKLATKEAVNEASSYIKNAAEYWVSPWWIEKSNVLGKAKNFYLGQAPNNLVVRNVEISA